MASQNPTETERKVTYGRGGVGNIGPPSPALKPSNGPSAGAWELETPTLKTAHYTTGRGGTGNMAKNDPERPEKAREAQDVKAPLAAELKKEHEYHTGRGGTANIYRPTESELEEAREHNTLVRSHSRDAEALRRPTGASKTEKVRGLAEKGKDKIIGGKSS